MYKKLTTYSLVLLWLSAIGSTIFVFTIIGNDGEAFNLFNSNEDSSNYAFYDKKLLNRNDKNVIQEVAVAKKIVMPQEAIKSSMLRQSVKLQSTTKQDITKQVITKPIIKEKAKAKPKSNDGFDIRPLPNQ